MTKNPDSEKVETVIKAYTKMGHRIEFRGEGNSYVVFSTSDGIYIFHDGNKEYRISSMRLYAIARVMYSDRFTAHDLKREELKLLERFPEAVSELGLAIGLGLGLVNEKNMEEFAKALEELQTSKDKKKMLKKFYEIMTTY